MPSYKFGDRENFSQEIPKGEYIFEVMSVEFGTQAKGKTAGSDTAELKLLFTDPKDGKKVGQFTETLIFAASMAWKLDVFVKASNLLINGKSPAKDTQVEFTAETLIGLRGYCLVDSEPSTTNPEKKYSRVKTWITDKQKLPKAAPAAPAQSQADGEEDASF